MIQMKNQMRKGYSSDYIQAKKQNAIYTSMKSDAQITGNTVNPLKKNGFYYNNMININVPKTCNASTCKGGILVNARSYQLRLDFKRGKYYNNYVCNCETSKINDVIGPCGVDIFDPCNSTFPCDISLMPGKEVLNCLCSPCAFN